MVRALLPAGSVSEARLPRVQSPRMGLLFAITPESMRKAVSKELEPGEEFVACAFGVWLPPKETVLKVLRYGLYVFGLIVLLFLRDKVLLAITNRRVLILVLTERYGHVVETHAFPFAAVTGIAHEKGSVYHEVRIVMLFKRYRFLFYPSPLGIAENGAEVLRIHERLAQDEGQFAIREAMARGVVAVLAKEREQATAGVGAPPPAAGEAASPEAPRSRAGCKRAALGCAAVVGPLVAAGLAWGVYNAVAAEGLVRDARSAVARHDLAVAEEKFKLAIERLPKPELYHELALVQMQRGERDAALESLRAARAMDPDYRPPADVAEKLAELLKQLDAGADKR